MKRPAVKRAGRNQMKWALLVLLFAAVVSRADVITLTNGSKIECAVLAETTERVTFRRGVSTFSLLRSQVESIQKDAPRAITKPIDPSRLPSEQEVIDILAREAWLKGLEQIPATVIDKGVLKNVPYLSHQCGDYEVNVYGDPESPACVEIGIYRDLLNDPSAKDRCISFMAELVGGERAAKLKTLSKAKDSTKVGDWTIEITPPTDEDAYGGWWISIYSEPIVDKSRAGAEEMKAITMDRQSASKQAADEKSRTETMLAMAQARDGGGIITDNSDNWTTTEIGRARKSSDGGGGTVYVRSYTRKDGTFVHSHTRSAPGSHGGRR
jgi:hypothetical protein